MSDEERFLVDIDYLKTFISKVPKIESQAKRLSIAPGTFLKIRNKERVTLAIVADIAAALDVPIGDIIIPNTGTELPNDRKWYESLRYGYYIDHERGKFGNLKWWSEELDLRADKGKKSSLHGIHYSGELVNQFGESFSLQGVLSGHRHFALTATRETEPVKKAVSFVIVYTQSVENVLCGTWSGINHVDSRTAVYSSLLAAEPLSKSQIEDLSARFKVELHLTTGNFGCKFESGS